MKHEDVFERLSPPSGGLADLRTRIEIRPRSALRFVPHAFAFAVAVAVLLMLVSRKPPPDLVARAEAHGDGAEIALGLTPTPNEPVMLTENERATTALTRVPTSREDVAFYWVGSTMAGGVR
ncbi:MAG: hypothetical protein ABI183_05935 [Polyangiaceae bacterium]